MYVVDLVSWKYAYGICILQVHEEQLFIKQGESKKTTKDEIKERGIWELRRSKLRWREDTEMFR